MTEEERLLSVGMKDCIDTERLDFLIKYQLQLFDKVSTTTSYSRPSSSPVLAVQATSTST